MVEQQVSRLSPKEQHLLEIASVAGSEFSAATVAVGLGEEITGCEKCCEELARCGQFLRTRGVEEWPDGTLAGRYGFVHALYRDVLYDRLTASQRMELHRRIGERKEIAYGTKAKTIAAELAVHFAQGRDYYRAVRYLQKAAGNAVDRHAFQEAIEHVAKGLELLHKWPAVSERAQQELLLHMSVIGPLMATKGEAAPEVEHAYAQIWALHQQLGERAQPFMVVLGYWVISIGRGEVRKARELAAQLMEMAQVKKNPLLSLWAHHALGVSLFHGGAPVEAHAALEEVETLYNTQQHPRYMFDPKLACLSFQALVRWTLGYPQQALGRSRAAEICAQRASHPYGFAFVLTAAAWLYENRREGNLAQQRAAALITLAQEHGFVQYETLGMLLQGGICVTQGAYEEGIRLLRQGLEARRGTSMELGASAWLVLLATAYLHTGQISEGHAALSEAEAVIQRTGECFYEAELYRIKGELLLQQAKTDN